ncbi:MAG: DUF1902 domain-containing protein [Pseudomonadota bacterium]
MPRTFTVKALWDAEAEVWTSESDIEGLHIEAETLDQFEEVLADIGAELVAANHTTDVEAAGSSLRDLIPAIMFVKPAAEAA